MSKVFPLANYSDGYNAAGGAASHAATANQVRPVLNLTAAYTLGVGDSGSIINVSQGAAYTITIPTPTSAAAGTWYDFYVTAPAANIVRIQYKAAGAGIMQGFVLGTPGAAGACVYTAYANLSGVNIGAAGPTPCVLGDHIYLTCDGTNWYAQIFTAAAAAAITIT